MARFSFVSPMMMEGTEMECSTTSDHEYTRRNTHTHANTAGWHKDIRKQQYRRSAGPVLRRAEVSQH